MINTETQKNASSKPELYTVLTTGRVLHLNLKKKWFMMIAKGVKTEEYREIKDYWIKRLKDMSLQEPFHAFKDFDKIIFKNGYSKDAPTMIVEFKGIKIDKGFNEWGAEKGRLYFVIKLGKVLFNNALM
tara:strand:- start:11 stop:397 length:387 start_codon:yes stop_codon:yes gene_type:complete